MTAYDEILRDKRIHDGILHEMFNMMQPAASRAIIRADGSIEAGGITQG